MRPVASAMSLILAALLAACSAVPPQSASSQAASSRAPKQAPVRVYIVERGDSLSRIARDLGVDFRALARENGLAEPYTIHPGQRLRLPGPGKLAAAPKAARTPAPAPAPTPAPAPRPSPAPAPYRPIMQTTPEAGAPGLAWPADGALVSQFGMLTAAGKPNDGIDLSMHPGQRLIAAAAGTVLFAGAEPRLGQLVIVDHGGGWVTAYAFSGQITVKEGDAVKYRERIGVSGTASRTMHFELRRDNAPRDPLLYLPARL
jgi:lipoprotein NlpD